MCIRDRLDGFYRDRSGKVTPVKATLAQDADFIRNIKKLVSTNLQVAFAAEGRADPLEGPPKDRIDSVMKESGSGDTELEIDPNGPLFNTKVKDESDSIVKKWWFWTIIGVVVAGGVAGGVAGAVLSKKAPADPFLPGDTIYTPTF